MKNKEKWSVIINAILTAISTVIGTLFLGDTVSLSVSERRRKKGTCRFVQVPGSL